MPACWDTSTNRIGAGAAPAGPFGARLQPASTGSSARTSAAGEVKMMATMPMTDRITGALLSLACGDALGAPAEFMSQSQLRSHWEELTEMVGGGVWAPGEWTDDTGMALCGAEGILAC